MSLFRYLRRAQGSILAQGTCFRFVTRSVITVISCFHLAQTQAGRPPLVVCPRLLIQYIRSYLHTGGRYSICNLRTRHAVMTGPTYHGQYFEANKNLHSPNLTDNGPINIVKFVS
jgi:hypothetical protein